MYLSLEGASGGTDGRLNYRWAHRECILITRERGRCPNGTRTDGDRCFSFSLCIAVLVYSSSYATRPRKNVRSRGRYFVAMQTRRSRGFSNDKNKKLRRYERRVYDRASVAQLAEKSRRRCSFTRAGRRSSYLAFVLSASGFFSGIWEQKFIWEQNKAKGKLDRGTPQRPGTLSRCTCVSGVSFAGWLRTMDARRNGLATYPPDWQPLRMHRTQRSAQQVFITPLLSSSFFPFFSSFFLFHFFIVLISQSWKIRDRSYESVIFSFFYHQIFIQQASRVTLDGEDTWRSTGSSTDRPDTLGCTSKGILDWGSS